MASKAPRNEDRSAFYCGRGKEDHIGYEAKAKVASTMA